MSAAVVVAYARAPGGAVVRGALRENDFLILVDNSVDREVKRRIKAIEAQNDGLIVEDQQVNVGVAKALNIAVRKAQSLGCGWIHFLDDDSSVRPGFFTAEREIFIKLQSEGRRVGAVGPLAVDASASSNPPSTRGQWSQVNLLITAGTLTTPQIIREVGGFDETLFVEGVDFDFSRRLSQRGYSLVRLNFLTIAQVFGEARTARSVKARLMDSFITGESWMQILWGSTNSFHTRYGLYSHARRREFYEFLRRGSPDSRGNPTLQSLLHLLLTALVDFCATGDSTFVRMCLER